MKNFTLFFLAILAFAFSSCSEHRTESLFDEIELEESKISITHGEVYEIEAESTLPLTYESQNEYHAKVDDKGVITGGYVGATEILVSNGELSKKLKVSVVPIHNTYDEPDIKIGDSRSDVIDKYGLPDFENESGLGYNNYSVKAPVLIVVLENNVVTGYSLLVASSHTQELTSFLSERYLLVYADSETYSLLFIDQLDIPTNGDNVIFVSLYNTDYWMVMYMAYDETSRSGTRENTMLNESQLRQRYDELLQLRSK